ncbi:dipeptide epimerase [Solimonas sp. K1W22B-7]|uniref:N-acetyl-D-Glu racemase DgcA n=1 Tax=Solimonas sp. K1W22B-7 TaxID=2303331 RepID=UPI000E335CDD|nr:N-acetyl-D-Glu racemase DgcA [Solimonas sp. K1W22B-7]AXQ31468.1 dipeptide epimerase [Solimonas sp. K1W22B-7]
MKQQLTVRPCSWRLKEPFVIARGTRTVASSIVVELQAGGHVGRGEGAGVAYRGETPESMTVQIERVRQAVESGATRRELLELLPPGGARNAVDAALWDLQAKQTGVRAWTRAGVPGGGPVQSVVTLGIRMPEAFEAAARRLADHPWLKVKVDRRDPVAAVAAVRRGAPRARLIVDANQSWDAEDLARFAPALLEYGVALLEQPLAAGHDEGLSKDRRPIPLCADESVNTIEDLPRLAGRYDFINIKLDKAGGLTAALELAAAAQRSGLRLMSGCMVGASLAMAPAMVLGQLCEINDLDGAFLLAEDWPDGIVYERGSMRPPWPAFWG